MDELLGLFSECLIIYMSLSGKHMYMLCCKAIDRTILLLISLNLINIWYVHIDFLCQRIERKSNNQTVQ